MGNSESIKKFYSNTDLQLENSIRDFELDLGFFRYNYIFIFSKLFFDNKLVVFNINDIELKKYNFYSDISINVNKDDLEIKETNEIIIQYFPKILIDFLNSPYFKTKDHLHYDIKKLKIFFFLISKDAASTDENSGFSYQNKANYFFSSIVTDKLEYNNMVINTNNNMNNTKITAKMKKFLFTDKYLLGIDDPKFLEFLTISVDISVKIIIEFYMNKKYILSGGYLENMKDYKTDIINKIIVILFDKNAPKNSFYNVIFEDINKRFKKNQFFLTSGFIRMIGYGFICEYNDRREQELVEKARSCCFLSF